MTVKRINPGPRACDAAVHGDTVYLSGLCGTAGESAAAQMRSALAQAETVLAQAGSDKSRILRVIIWLNDRNDFEEMNGVWDKWVAGGNTPARATGEVGLMGPGLRVELIITAAI